jgi:hypothetical protein
MRNVTTYIQYRVQVIRETDSGCSYEKEFHDTHEPAYNGIPNDRNSFQFQTHVLSPIYRVIQSSISILKEVFGDHLEQKM